VPGPKSNWVRDQMRADYENHNVLWSDEPLRESAAFRSLHGTAILVLMDFHAKKHMKKKGQKHVLTNNGELVYTYREAQTRGIGPSTFMKALDTLIGRGFIDVTATGEGRYRSESRYALSNRWRHWETDAFIPAKRNPHGRNKEYGFQPGHTLRDTDGKLKNVIENDNGSDAKNGPMLIENDNGSVAAVIKSDNEPLSKMITGKIKMCIQSDKGSERRRKIVNA